ncbi:hypothetical protein [Streptomyces canus]|uniref:hypothetical protein n=1 Tax=Streptomyces canus TaxID=58343 RepID=UPI00339EDC5B
MYAQSGAVCGAAPGDVRGDFEPPDLGIAQAVFLASLEPFLLKTDDKPGYWL